MRLRLCRRHARYRDHDRARNEGRSEEELIADMSLAHQRDFAGFGVELTIMAARTVTKTANFAVLFGRRYVERM